MPRPSLLPPADVIYELRQQGWRLLDIAEQYEVSVSAVQKALRRAGLADEQITYRHVVPWKVDARLTNTAVMQRLRSIAKQKQGYPLEEEERRLLEEWFDLMAENNVVLDYHPDAPPNDASTLGGWFYRTRVPEDQDFYRAPEVQHLLEEREK
jgi:hypothetical protein